MHGRQHASAPGAANVRARGCECPRQGLRMSAPGAAPRQGLRMSAPGAANVRARGCECPRQGLRMSAPQSIPRTPLVSEVRKRNGPEVAATNAPEPAAVRPSMGGAAQEAAATCDKGSLSGAARASLGLTFSRNLFPTCQEPTHSTHRPRYTPTPKFRRTSNHCHRIRICAFRRADERPE